MKPGKLLQPYAMRYLGFTATIVVLGAVLAAHALVSAGSHVGARQSVASGNTSDQDEWNPAGRCGAGTPGFLSDSTISVQRLIGMPVTNPINERIGEVSDLVVDQCGRIKTIVVHIGGFLGVGGRHVRLSLDRHRARIRSLDRSSGPVVVVRQTRDHILSGGSAVSRDDGDAAAVQGDR